MNTQDDTYRALIRMPFNDLASIIKASKQINKNNSYPDLIDIEAVITNNHWTIDEWNTEVFARLDISAIPGGKTISELDLHHWPVHGNARYEGWLLKDAKKAWSRLGSLLVM